MQNETTLPSSADIHSESFLNSLMARQLKLSIACALTFLLALLGLPLANYFWPELMATRVLGFTLTWFVLGVLFFPLVWIISYVFIRRSIALEKAEVSEAKIQDPGSKIQINTKGPSSKGGPTLLMFGVWSFSGASSLVFGA
jgi:uncharacterized membrane protein (DUF485 family)